MNTDLSDIILSLIWKSWEKMGLLFNRVNEKVKRFYEAMDKKLTITGYQMRFQTLEFNEDEMPERTEHKLIKREFQGHPGRVFNKLPRLCYHCHTSGHFANSCPQRHRYDSSN